MKAFLAGFTLLFLVGCSALDRALLKPQVTTLPPTVVSTNLVLSTNYVTLPATTNAVTGAITPPSTNAVVTPTLVFTYAPPVTTTNWVVSPTAKAVTDLAGSLPVPYAGLAGIAATWLLTLYANIRNKKALSSVVSGIEAVRTGLQTTPEGQALDAKIKQKLVEHQELAGTLKIVSSVVDSITGNTTKPAENLGQFVGKT